MSSYTRGKKRNQLTFVLVTQTVAYGFKTKDLSGISGVSSSDLAALGHTVISAVGSGVIKILGANSPKPARVKKSLDATNTVSQSSVSTFCAYNKLADAAAAGWSVTKARRLVALQALSDLRKSCTAVAELSNNLLYCFPMNKVDYVAYGGTLGLQESGTIGSEERDFLVAGMSSTRPGRAQLLLEGGATIQSFFSYSELDNIGEAGWSIIDQERLFDPVVTP